MSRAQWRQLATRIRASISRRPTTTPIPARLQLDLMVATDQRIAAHTRRNRWL